MEKEEKQREHVDMQDAFDALMSGLLTNVKNGSLTRTRRLSAVWCQTEHS